jgi:hypothetical protein
MYFIGSVGGKKESTFFVQPEFVFFASASPMLAVFYTGTEIAKIIVLFS